MKTFPEGTCVTLDIDMGDDLRKGMRGTVKYYKKNRPTDAGVGVLFDGCEGISIGRPVPVEDKLEYTLVIDNVSPITE